MPGPPTNRITPYNPVWPLHFEAGFLARPPFFDAKGYTEAKERLLEELKQHVEG